MKIKRFILKNIPKNLIRPPDVNVTEHATSVFRMPVKYLMQYLQYSLRYLRSSNCVFFSNGISQ